MPTPALALLAAAAASTLIAMPAQAAAGALSFAAGSSTTIAPGGTVNFEAIFTKYQDFVSSGIAEPEPVPAVGAQTWLVSAESTTGETLSSFSLQAWSTNGEGQGFAMPTLAAGPGSLFGHVWTFSLGFSQPGSYSVTLGGSWQSMASIDDTSVQANRTCALDGAGVLGCTDWTYLGMGSSALMDTSGNLAPLTLTVQVVPEPGTTALWLLGLAAGGAGALRRRRAGAVSPR